MKQFKSIIFLLLCLLPVLSWSKDFNNQIGGGTYHLSVDEDHEMKGNFVSYMRSFGSVAALKANYFKADHKTITGGESSGFDVNFLAIGRFKSVFNVSLGLGYFSETWNLPVSSVNNAFGKVQSRAWPSQRKAAAMVGENDYSGLQILLGAGFSYKYFAINYWFIVRHKASYEENFGSDLPGLELIPIVQNLEIAIRF